jgi:hypothetical protein
MSACEYAELDGSYVLGTLSPSERQDYERHLNTCADCSQAVRELAGLPGLLARVDPVILEPAPAVEPVPATLLPSLVREVERIRRRRWLAVAGTAAAAVLAIAVLAVQGFGDDASPPVASPPSASPSVSAPAGNAMAPVGHVPVTATLAVTPVGWGTKLELTCSYEPEEGYQLPKTATYGLFVVNRDGSAEQVGTWRAIGGKTMHFSAGTAAKQGEIADVEVRTVDGKPVLKLES